MKTANKIFYIVATLLEVSLLIGAYVVNYFTHKKMGMLRHVVYKNNFWEDKYPIVQIEYISIVLLVILMILVFTLYAKRKAKLKNSVLIMNIAMVLLVVFYTGFTLLYSTEELRAFYYMSLMLGVATFIQVIKSFIGVLFYKNEK
ncbi:hypothetical protein [Metaclostridioides mangenotii]|uniref:hypothetical protein n=1 Tax=Metaclostridioides mangenotii TaxID=1540 RepID=UPI00048033DE|nr:hypothetical protein [Clostridioides mangenotii]